MRFQEVLERIRHRFRQFGFWPTLRFLFSRVLRRHRFLVFDACLDGSQSLPKWGEDEQVQIIGTDNLDAEMNPNLLRFLGGDEAVENLAGIRNGDLLFVVRSGSTYLHAGYVFFRTRQTRLLGETTTVPLIGCCGTAPSAQGRGLYRRALQSELCYLHGRGFSRVLIETDPQNIPSRKGIEAAGFRLCRELSGWIFLNRLVCQTVVNSSGRQRRIALI